MTTRTPLFLLLLNLALLLSSSTTKAQSDIERDALMRAMSDELKRSVERLVLKDAEKPYFIEYACTETESYWLTATFGSIVDSNHERERDMRAEVRVGGYDFDNSGYISTNDIFGMGDEPTSMVIEDDYNALRHDLWLATDYAYKQSVQQVARKRAALKNKVDDDKLPDYSREQPTILVKPRQSLVVEQQRWAAQAREWSSIFRKFPAIDDSRVQVNLRLTHRYLTNSEGTMVRRPEMLVAVEAFASAQTDDGRKLSHSVPFRAPMLDALPKLDEITSAIVRMAEELTALRSAPTLDKTYSGPVMFTGQASAEMIAQLLAPNLSGERPPMADPQIARMVEGRKSVFADRINRPVIVSSISVADDPTLETFDGKALVGSYPVDEEGVPARRIQLVENGALKTLLTSRRPSSKEILVSNGHGRAGLFGGPDVQTGNLIVQATGGKSYDELKKEMIALVTAQNLEYGIVIRSLATTGGSDDVESMIVMFGGGPGGGAERSEITRPVLAYRLYSDGREELVRGITVKDISAKSLRQITSVGNDAYVLNRVSQGMSPFGGGGYGIPMSVVAPSILFEELEVKNAGGEQSKPVLLSHPFFEKK